MKRPGKDILARPFYQANNMIIPRPGRGRL